MSLDIGIKAFWCIQIAFILEMLVITYKFITMQKSRLEVVLKANRYKKSTLWLIKSKKNIYYKMQKLKRPGFIHIKSFIKKRLCLLVRSFYDIMQKNNHSFRFFDHKILVFLYKNINYFISQSYTLPNPILLNTKSKIWLLKDQLVIFLV